MGTRPGAAAAVVRRRWQTRVPDEAAHHLDTAFPGMHVSLGRVDEDRPFSFAEETVVTPRFAIARLVSMLGGRATGWPAGVVTIGLASFGWGRASGVDGEVDTSRPFRYPDHVEGEWTTFDQQAISVPLGAVEAAARRMTGDPDHRIRFFGTAPVDPASDAYLRSVARYLDAVSREPGLLEEPFLQQDVARTLIGAVLSAFPNSALDALAEGRPPQAAPDATRLAAEFIEANAGRPIGMAEIAAAASAPSVALTDAFRSAYGHTPLQHLRSVRLAEARADLLAGDPASATVEATARRWGFAHPGRFAAAYRARFGEPPSETLRR